MLTIDPIVRVNISVGSGVVPTGEFTTGAVLGPSGILAEDRYAVYNDLDEMLEAGFSTSSPEYMAALKYFAVDPAPSRLVVIHYAGTITGEAYSSSKTYAKGDYCTNNNKTWRCNTAITTAEAWNADHWTEITSLDDSPAKALADAISKGAEFYAVYYCPASNTADATVKANIVAIDTYLNAISTHAQFYGVVGTADELTADGALFPTFKEANSERSFGMKCKSSADDAAGAMGEGMGLALKYKNGSFALAYKPIPSAEVDSISQSDIAKIKEANGNVYVARTKQHNCFENGTSGSGLRFDEVLYLDRIAHDVQEACFNLIAEYPRKLALADSSTTLFIAEINRVLEQYYNAGVLATNPWRGQPVGEIENGDTIEHGYAAFADSYNDQSAEDRQARKAMPITILLCLAGSVETIVLYVNVQT